MGKRGAVGINSGDPVDHSGPGLGRPTTPPTAGRQPEACPPLCQSATHCLSLSQPKSGQGSGDGVPSGGEAAKHFASETIRFREANPLPAASCRPRLIACNSRQLDDPPENPELRKQLQQIAVEARRLPICCKCFVVHVFKQCDANGTCFEEAGD